MSVAIGPGVLFGSYRIEAVVSRGGMGVVYRATDLSLERPVALKVIAPELAQDPEFRERFLREPRLAASLDHPNVVPIYEAGEREGQLYLAMRWVAGSDLRQLLERAGRLSPEVAVGILTQVAEALDATHRGGLVHRDVKPANILVDEDGHAYLSDFGISQRHGGESAAGGKVLGTLDYLAPEQIRNEDVDGRADCFALACVLYECLSGAPPFRRASENETLWAHLRDPPAPLRAHPSLAPVIGRALAKEREDRYPACAEMVRSAAAALGVAAPGVGGRRVSRAAALMLAGGLLLAAASGLALLSSRGDDGGSQPAPALDVATNSVAAVDVHDNTVTLAVPLPGRPTDVAVSGGTAWVSTVDSTSVTGVSARTRSITRARSARRQGGRGRGGRRLPLGGGRAPRRRVRASCSATSASRSDSGSARRSSAVRPVGRLRGSRASLAVGAGMVWLANGTRQVMRIDPRTGRLARFPAAGRIDAVAAGGGAVWALGSRPATVIRIDPGAGRPSARVALGEQGGPEGPVPDRARGHGLRCLGAGREQRHRHEAGSEDARRRRNDSARDRPRAERHRGPRSNGVGHKR